MIPNKAMHAWENDPVFFSHRNARLYVKKGVGPVSCSLLQVYIRGGREMCCAYHAEPYDLISSHSIRIKPQRLLHDLSIRGLRIP